MSNKYKKVKNKDMYFLGSLIGSGAGAIAGALGADEKTQGMISGGAGLIAGIATGDPFSAIQGGIKGITSATMAEGGSLTQFNNGGTHEQNPLGGIPIGPNALVEQGETKSGDFVYSDRVVITPQVAKEFSIPKRFIGKTFADASKFYDDKERANDPITKRGTERELDNLALAQESFKAVENGQDIGRNVRQMAYGGGIKLAEGGTTDEYESMVASKIMPKKDSKNPFSVSVKYLQSKGYSKPEIEKILDLSYKIASQESGFNFKDGNVSQTGDGPGKGIFQYEQGVNSVDAMARYYKMMKETGNTDDPIYKEIAKKVKRPNAYQSEIFLDANEYGEEAGVEYSEAIKKLATTDEFKQFSNFNRFSAAGQHAMFIADKVLSPSAKKGLDAYLAGDMTAPDYWVKHHGRFNEEDIPARMKSWGKKEELFKDHIDSYTTLLTRDDKPVVTPYMDNREIEATYRPDWQNPTSKDPNVMAEGGELPKGTEVDYKEALRQLSSILDNSINDKVDKHVTGYDSKTTSGITRSENDPNFSNAVDLLDNESAKKLYEDFISKNPQYGIGVEFTPLANMPAVDVVGTRDQINSGAENNIPRQIDPSQLEQPNSNIGQTVDVTERRQSLPLNNFDYLSQNPGLIGDLATQQNMINAVTPINTQKPPQIQKTNPKSAEYSLPSLPQSPEESLSTGTEKDIDKLSNVSEFKLGDTLNAAGQFVGDNLRYAPALTSAVNLGISAFSRPDMIDPSQFQTNQQFNPNLVDRNQLRRDAVSRTNAMIGNARQATNGNAGAFMANAAAANAQGQRAIGQANLQADVADAGELGRVQQLRAQQAQRNAAAGLHVQDMNDANQQSYQAQLMDQIASLGNNLGGVGLEQYRIDNINNSGAWLYGTEGQFTGKKKENE